MAAALATSWLLGSAPARAQVTSEPSAVIFPDPAKFARGFYTEGEVGAVTFFGPASDAVAPGFAVGARFGYDIFRFFALQLHALGSTHQTKGDTPFSGQLLQTYQGTIEGKLTHPVRAVVDLRRGRHRRRAHVDEPALRARLARYRTGFTAGGGGGIDYHSLSRHFSIGLRAGYYVLFDVSSSQDLITTAYLRYTF